MAARGRCGRFKLPRPLLKSPELNFSFSGLKTAVLMLVQAQKALDDQTRADIACAFQEAIVEVLVAKALAATDQTGFSRLVVAGGVGANGRLREQLSEQARRRGIEVFYPPLEFCTDNGAMIAFAGAARLQDAGAGATGFTVRPRWELSELPLSNARLFEDEPSGETGR